jgi:sortase A
MTEHHKVNNHSTSNGTGGSNDPAVELLRQKISNLYHDEPDTKKEIIDAEQAGRHRSKHQQFLHQLTTSGKSLAEIQTAWHRYYIELPDNEKHEVWQEFYTQHGTHLAQTQHTAAEQSPIKHPAEIHSSKQQSTHNDNRSVADVKNQILSNVQKNSRKKLSKKAHFHSLLFGLGVGLITIAFLLFGFFNERFIAPFISPSKNVSNAPIIIDASTAAVGPESKIIIPKINVEIPVVYDEPSVEEKSIQHALERGVVHYASTPEPGQTGNGVIFGHSSNNILNKGKYKFAFVLLKRLEAGDTFILQKDGKRYVYKVTDKKIVKPSDVSILNNQASGSTMTLVTCDPPGTSLNRLLVVGQQISPDPSSNIASKSKPSDYTPKTLPSNAPSLWDRLTSLL